jgi:spermidine synthase
VHEVAWSRALGQVLGGALPAQAIVLGTYLFGLGAGAAWAGRRTPAGGSRPLRLYGGLEIAVAAWGLLAPLLARAAAVVVEKAGPAFGDGAPIAALRLATAALVLLPGTFAMGATFPVAVRALPAGTARRGAALLYGVNTLAGAAGALLASFALLPLVGTRRTFAAAALLNLAAGLAALAADRRARRGPTDAGDPAPASAPVPAPAPAAPPAWTPLAAAGFAAGVAGALMQFGWTRAMTLAFGSTIYALGLTLAACLTGLGAGPLVVTWGRARAQNRARGRPGARVRPARDTAAFAAWLAGAAGLLLLPALGALPSLAMRLSLVFEHHPFRALALQFAGAALLLLIPALAQGSLLPLLIETGLAGERGADDRPAAASGAGRLYAASTWGTVAGFLAAGFVVVPRLGARLTLALAAAILLAIGALLLPRPLRRAPIFAAPLLLLLLPGWDAGAMSAGGFLYGPLYRAAFGGAESPARAALAQAVARRGRVIFEREDGDGLTTVREAPGGTLSLQINGKTEASSGADMPTQLLAGHLPLLLVPDAADVLVIGLASGVSLGAVERHPVRSIRVLEIARGVPEAARRFAAPNRNALDDRRVALVVDDARAWMLARDERYDVIVSQPSNPWVAGVANLFTAEFYRLARARLRPGGVMCQWVQAYRILPEDLRSVVRSFLDVFPDATLWEESAGGGDYFLVGGLGDPAIDLEALERAAPEAWRDLGDAGRGGPPGLLSRFVAGPRSLGLYTAGVRRHTDDALTLEWRAPLALFRETRGRALPFLELPREPVTEHLAPTPLRDDPAFRMALARSLGRRQARLQEAAGLRDADLIALREPALAAGLALLASGRGAEAAAALQRAAAAAPGSANAHYLLGLAYREAGLASPAAVAFEHAVEVDPGLTPAWNALGLARRTAGDQDGARQAFSEAVRSDPGDAIARNNLGTILLQDGNLDAAEEAFRIAAREAPWLAAARANLGVVARRRGDLVTAERELRAALALDPMDENARLNFEMVLREAGQPPTPPPAPSR